MDFRFLLIGSAALALGACERIDPLAVIESPDGSHAILDQVGTRSKGRFICIRTKGDLSCPTRDADVIVSSVGPAVELHPNWDMNGQVVIRVASGKVERAATAAANGRVNIRVEK